MPFASDTFTDTNGILLQNHTSNSGHTWSKIAGDTDITIQTNEARLRSDTSSVDDALYVINATPPSADYYVQAVCRHGDPTSSNALVGVVARCDETGANRYQAYLFGGSAGNRGLRLVKSVAGSGTTLGTYLFDWAGNTNYTIKLECRGSTIRVFLDGVERINVTDTSISSANKGGIRLVAAGSSLDPNHAWVDNFEVDVLIQTLTQTAGISSAEAFGNSVIQVRFIQLSGIPSGEMFGLHKLFNLLSQVASLQSGETFGNSKLIVIVGQPSGIPSGFISSLHKVYNLIRQSYGIASGEKFGLGVIYEMFAKIGVNPDTFQVIQVNNDVFIVVFGNSDEFTKL